MLEILLLFFRGKTLQAMICAMSYFAKEQNWEIAIGRDESGENATDIILAPPGRLEWIVDLIEKESPHD